MKQEQSDVSAYVHSKTFGRAKAAQGGRELNLSRNLEARVEFEPANVSSKVFHPAPSYPEKTSSCPC